MAEYKEWAVELVVTTEHSYTVVARTEEEAVSLAENLFDEGDEGDIVSTTVETAYSASAANPNDDEGFLEEDVIFDKQSD